MINTVRCSDHNMRQNTRNESPFEETYVDGVNYGMVSKLQAQENMRRESIERYVNDSSTRRIVHSSACNLPEMFSRYHVQLESNGLMMDHIIGGLPDEISHVLTTRKSGAPVVDEGCPNLACNVGMLVGRGSVGKIPSVLRIMEEKHMITSFWGYVITPSRPRGMRVKLYVNGVHDKCEEPPINWNAPTRHSINTKEVSALVSMLPSAAPDNIVIMPNTPGTSYWYAGIKGTITREGSAALSTAYVTMQKKDNNNRLYKSDRVVVTSDGSVRITPVYSRYPSKIFSDRELQVAVYRIKKAKENK